MPSRAGSQSEDMYGAQYSEDGFLVYDSRKSFEEPVQGILLSDSFLMAKEDSEWILYASQVIAFLELTMGLVFVVVVKPGACMYSPSGNDYLRMLEVYDQYLMRTKSCARLQSMLVISMGNDLYRLGHPYIVPWQVREAAVWLAAFLKARNVPRTVMVYGGSATLWQYYAFGKAIAIRYDQASQQIRSLMTYAGFPVTSGEAELGGITTEDDIGHISKSSIAIALRAVYYWLRDTSKL